MDKFVANILRDQVLKRFSEEQATQLWEIIHMLNPNISDKDAARVVKDKATEIALGEEIPIDGHDLQKEIAKRIAKDPRIIGKNIVKER